MPKGTIRPIELDTSEYQRRNGREPDGKGEFRFRSESGKVWPPAGPTRGNYDTVCRRLIAEAARGVVPGGRWRVEPGK